MPGDASDKILPATSGAASADYAGDVSVAEAWRVLSENPKAVLVDVRTRAEWSFVGVADLGSLNKEPVLVEWASFPAMNVNENFASEVASVLNEVVGGGAKAAPVLFLCRSGARSRSAAKALTALGFSAAYNIVGGFEGDLDETRQRGHSSGWKASGLPWIQS
ncbi:MAG: rhodanese-like domain-containing protein [Parvibaculum sp.]|nr:rhodanese-like domain-containing protein [Parvibaculum sp.]